jgi:hypothetical protein
MDNSCSPLHQRLEYWALCPLILMYDLRFMFRLTVNAFIPIFCWCNSLLGTTPVEYLNALHVTWGIPILHGETRDREVTGLLTFRGGFPRACRSGTLARESSSRPWTEATRGVCRSLWDRRTLYSASPSISNTALTRPNGQTWCVFTICWGPEIAKRVEQRSCCGYLAEGLDPSLASRLRCQPEPDLLRDPARVYGPAPRTCRPHRRSTPRRLSSPHSIFVDPVQSDVHFESTLHTCNVTPDSPKRWR